MRSHSPSLRRLLAGIALMLAPLPAVSATHPFEAMECRIQVFDQEQPVPATLLDAMAEEIHDFAAQLKDGELKVRIQALMDQYHANADYQNLPGLLPGEGDLQTVAELIQDIRDHKGRKSESKYHHFHGNVRATANFSRMGLIYSTANHETVSENFLRSRYEQFLLEELFGRVDIGQIQ